MSDLLTLPTRRDEDWRYADADYLASAKLADLNQWREINVPAGKSVTEARTLTTGGVERLRVTVGAGGRFALFLTNAAGTYSRAEVEVDLGEEADFTFGGVTLGGEATTREFITCVRHGAPSATSSQVVRAVHWGQGTGNFLGRIEVTKEGQKTDSSQNFKAILLEPGASANTKPELEIYADDVKAAHGAAIGALDERAAFYMAARGISPDVARRLLVRAFVADAFVALDDETLREAMLDDALLALDESML